MPYQNINARYTYLPQDPLSCVRWKGSEESSMSMVMLYLYKIDRYTDREISSKWCEWRVWLDWVRERVRKRS